MSNVVLIESMPDGSYESVEIMEWELKYNPAYSNLKVYKETVENKTGFKEIVDTLVKMVSTETKLILHLCVHGDENGIAFKRYDEANPSAEDYMVWDELIQTVIPLNVSVNCNLVLVLQACYSAKLGERMSNSNFCKYLIVGEGLVYSRELESLFQFYKTYSETDNVKFAYDAMKSTKYYDIKHNEIQISSIYKCFSREEFQKISEI